MSKLLKQKKLLMLSAKDSEIPFILTARNMGYYVITTGNKSDRSGHRYADEYIPFDFSDYDGLALRAKDLEIDALCQGCNDHCALAASAVGSKLGFVGHDSLEVATVLHRKDRFKEFAGKMGLPCPVSKWFTSQEEALEAGLGLEGPLIVKPTDSAGGAGVSVARSREEYEIAVKNAFSWSAEKRIVVEPFVEGSLHSLSTFIVNGHVVASMTANDYSFKNEYLTNSGAFPAEGGEEAARMLVPVVEQIAQELDLVDGLLHLQYIKDREGRFWIIEMMRRSPGNNYTVALSRSTGINWQEWILRAEAGEDLSGFPAMREPDAVHAYHSIMAAQNGVVSAIEIDDDLDEFIYQYVEWNGPGSVVADYMNEKMGSIQLRFPDAHTCDSVMADINNRVRVVMQGGAEQGVLR